MARDSLDTRVAELVKQLVTMPTPPPPPPCVKTAALPPCLYPPIHKIQDQFKLQIFYQFPGADVRHALDSVPPSSLQHGFYEERRFVTVLLQSSKKKERGGEKGTGRRRGEKRREDEG